MVTVAQLVRALGCDPNGCGFEPHPSQIGEHLRTHKELTDDLLLNNICIHVSCKDACRITALLDKLKIGANWDEWVLGPDEWIVGPRVKHTYQDFEFFSHTIKSEILDEDNELLLHKRCFENREFKELIFEVLI